MKIYIDFSIFDSPVRAYGNVSGYIDAPSLPQIGEQVTLFKNGTSLTTPEFSGSLPVVSITPVSGNEGEVVVGLEDVVLSSKDAARKLGKQLEDECGLFCVDYHPE